MRQCDGFDELSSKNEKNLVIRRMAFSMAIRQLFKDYPDTIRD